MCRLSQYLVHRTELSVGKRREMALPECGSYDHVPDNVVSTDGAEPDIIIL